MTGSASPGAAGLPQVCVLVRTMGRATLAEALRSVLEQDGVALSVKVVAAQGGPWQPHGAVFDDARVEVVTSDRPLGRSQAANRALAAIDAPLALFLDDDDWLLSGHLQRLALALAERPDAVAAHAGVECRRIADSGDAAVMVFDEPVDRAEMQLRNQLPIHAVLFRTSVVRAEPAMAFDEALTHFEDWDFWLQLMQRGGLVHVPGVSAVYRLDDASGSGHASEDQVQRQARLASFGHRQLRRWTPTDVAGLIDRHAALAAEGQQARQALELNQQAFKEQWRLVDEDRSRWQVLAREAERDRDTTRVLFEEDRTRFEAELAAHQASAHELQLQLAAYRAEGDKLAALRLEHLALIERQDGQVQALLNSTSWRITRPMRGVAGALTRLRGLAWAMPARNLGLALRTELRRFGWAGLLRRLPNHLRQWRARWRVLAAPAPTQRPDWAPAERTATLGPMLHAEIDGPGPTLPHTVSVVIPTLNGGAELDLLLRKLRDQQGVAGVEIVVVDSGSRDDTVAHARAHGAVVVQITPAEFSHSHARNLGADAASGDFVLFMVQDAFPIGRYWLHSMLAWLLAHRTQGVVAASCSEYCRSDSDLMYDSMVHTHYRFLGCHEFDRIGELRGTDHMALRSLGQLSDVACLIDRATFQAYRYRGDYAEDLDLGIRLIRDGHKVAMLASVKVIHSHNRTAHYYLKRSFVDVIFLVGMFDDFVSPPCASAAGLIDGVQAAARRLEAWMRGVAESGEPFAWDQLRPTRWAWRAGEATPHESIVSTAAGADTSPLGDVRLARFIAELPGTGPALGRGESRTQRSDEARKFHDSFVARLDHVLQFIESVYGTPDQRLREEATQAVVKIYASAVGAALAFAYLGRHTWPEAAPERGWIENLYTSLKAGV